MKNFFTALSVLIAILAFSSVRAQDFKRAGGNGCFVTKWDTVTQTNAIVRDTFNETVSIDRNTVGFEMELERMSGSGIDTAVLTMWATRVAGGTTGWVRIQTFQVADKSETQFFMCQYPESRNPYTGYMFTYECLRANVTNTVRWRTHLAYR